MTPELQQLIQKKRKSALSLRKEIADNLSASERIFFLLNENLRDERQKATEEMPDSASDDALQVEGILDSIISSSEGASLGELKSQKTRLKALKNTLKTLTESLSEQEGKRISNQVAQTEEALNNALSLKSRLSSRASGFFKNYGVDASSIAVGAAGGDPIGAFIARMAGGAVEKGLESRRARKQQMLADKRGLYENVRDSGLSVRGPATPTFNDATEPLQQSGNFGEQNSTIKLDQIEENTSEMKKDIKILVEQEAERLKKEQQNPFDTLEDTAEGGRKKGIKDFLVKEKSDMKNDKGWISSIASSLGGDILGGVIGGVVGGAALKTLAATIGTVALPILLPITIAAIAGYAWYRALKALPQALADLPKSGYEKKRESGQKLTTKEEFIFKGEQLRKAKQELADLKAREGGFFGVSKDNQLHQKFVKIKEAEIKLLDDQLVQNIQAAYPNASPSEVTKIYNKASRLEGEAPMQDSRVMFKETTEKDLYRQKLEKVKERGQQMGWSPEKTLEVMQLVSKPGEAGFKVGDKMLEANQLERPITTKQYDKDMSDMIVDKKLGSLSAKFESGTSNTATKAGLISTGANDPGGKSYGPHQLSSKAGTLSKYLEQSAFGQEFMGLVPGSSEFDAKWKEVASRNPEAFADDQKKFISQTHFEPASRVAKDLGFKLENPGVREAVFSGSVQHGGINKILQRASETPGFAEMSPQEQLKVFYDARSQYTDQLAAVPYAAGRGRYESELPEALKLSKMDVLPQQNQEFANLGNLSAKNMQLESSMGSGSNTNIVNNTNIASSDNAPGGQRGINGPVATRAQEPTLLAIQEKSMKGAVT